MDQILLPRPAATVLSLRDGPEGYEVLMLRRNLNSDFVGGAYVFPGGGVDEADAGTAAQRLAFGLDDEEASKRLNLAAGGLAYFVACVRELFEEAGLLVACDEHGAPFRFSSHEVVHRLAAHRRAVNNSTMGFVEMMELEKITLDLRGIAYLANRALSSRVPSSRRIPWSSCSRPGGARPIDARPRDWRSETVRHVRHKRPVAPPLQRVRARTPRSTQVPLRRG